MEHVLKALDEGQAEDIVTIDLHGKSSIADALVIATGRSQRQLGALAERVRDAAREAGKARISIEGQAQGDWVLIDTGDVIVHLFRPDVRKFYNLEKMWAAPFPDDEAANG